ncbi:MAG TPA: hypothetical protein VFY79_05715 [Dehalococcoidia bacterium]|nr:hypothetical protein [Dehalococcoidia bacterium]
MALVYARLLIEPDRLTVGRALAEAGMIKPPPWQFQRSDIPRLIEFLWLYWFDRSEENNQKQSKTIKDNQ